MTNPLKQRAKDGAIKSPALNITLISGGTIAVGTIITRFPGVFEDMLGFKPVDHPGPAAAVLVSLVAAIGVIVAGDLIARGLASSRVSEAAEMPEGLTASIVKTGADDPGYTVAAAQVTSAGLEFFVVKEGATPSWRRVGTEDGCIRLHGPA